MALSGNGISIPVSMPGGHADTSKVNPRESDNASTWAIAMLRRVGKRTLMPLPTPSTRKGFRVGYSSSP
jgi:hypothetical protein